MRNIRLATVESSVDNSNKRYPPELVQTTELVFTIGNAEINGAHVTGVATNLSIAKSTPY